MACPPLALPMINQSTILSLHHRPSITLAIYKVMSNMMSGRRNGRIRCLLRKLFMSAFSCLLIYLIVCRWARLLYNICLWLFLLSFLVNAGLTLYNDYLIKFDYFRNGWNTFFVTLTQQCLVEIMMENGKCQRQYEDNKCHPDTRVPALIHQCMEWDQCLGRSPHAIAGYGVHR